MRPHVLVLGLGLLSALSEMDQTYVQILDTGQARRAYALANKGLEPSPQCGELLVIKLQAMVRSLWE